PLRNGFARSYSLNDHDRHFAPRRHTEDGRPVPPASGQSLRPAFARDGTVPCDSLWWLHGGNRAPRVGDWKIVAAGKDSPWELYDLRSDRSETRDLARERPEKVRELAALWEREFEAYRALAAADLPPDAKTTPKK